VAERLRHELRITTQRAVKAEAEIRQLKMSVRNLRQLANDAPPTAMHGTGPPGLVLPALAPPPGAVKPGKKAVALSSMEGLLSLVSEPVVAREVRGVEAAVQIRLANTEDSAEREQILLEEIQRQSTAAFQLREVLAMMGVSSYCNQLDTTLGWSTKGILYREGGGQYKIV